MDIASFEPLDNLLWLHRQPKEMSEPATTLLPSTLRYRQRPIEKLRLRLSDFASLVPTEHLLRDLPGEDFIEIDAGDSLFHIVPRISIRTLSEERPDLFSPVDEFIKLPAHRIAAAYRLDEETYDPADKFSPEEKNAPVLSGDFLAAAGNLNRIPVNQADAPVEPTLPECNAPELPPASEPEPAESPTASDQPLRLIELIHSLPTFHRFSPAATIIEPLILEAENHGTDIPDQDSLQALFLTDEKLTLRRVVELCGDLPGIRSCVLTRDDTILASHNVPENLDLVAMSSTASKMLSAMQDSSIQLGVGAVPALTLHTERGPLSIVQNNRLTLLVVHADRGFIPGVREKLTAALGELSRAPLALPSAAAPGGGMPLPPASE